MKTRHSLYATWAMMKQRCYNPNHINYGDYGGRGIAVCDEWLDSPAQFIEDMGPKPTPQHSIERKDNNKGYSPDNCCWATGSEQQRNTRKRKDNTSGIVGVRWNNRAKKWMARIGVNGEKINLGTFDTIPEAAEARKQGEIKYWI